MLGAALLHHDASRVLRAWTGPTPEQERLRARYVRHLDMVDVDSLVEPLRVRHEELPGR
jgi:hypothetical protein